MKIRTFFGVGPTAYARGAAAIARLVKTGPVLSTTCSRLTLLATLLVSLAFAAFPANADILDRGMAVVTGFSGTKQADPPPAGNPLDETFINLDGASAEIIRLEPGAPPSGQLFSSPPVFEVKAGDVGQVFAVGLDGIQRPAADSSNIYLGATSAFGLQIVLPDSDGDGRPERVKTGGPNAEWMAGQFGLEKGGGPGSIWKVDGKTGAVALFATIASNSGPGLGDIIFDAATRQFFVSDLDSGLIHRLDSSGTLLDTFDHGQTGRTEAGLPAVADDGARADIKSPAFDSENPATWGFTQPERRVWGLGLRAGRLYYAVAEGPSIWSVSINLDGTFGADPRREIEVSGTPANNPISDIAFDNADFMYVAQRGGIKGSYDYSVFADPKQSVVFRFKREIPDDPATPGIWVPIPDEYAIGFPPDYRNTSGGIALGYGYDETGTMRVGACDAYLWSTGDSLRDNAEYAAQLAAGGPAIIHGLQGNDRSLIRPDNEPPLMSYFVDYDEESDDPKNQGHAGDVEIWQPCDPKADFGSYAPAPYLPFDIPPTDLPPGEFPPEGIPPDWTPPVGWPQDDFNLRLDKEAVPGACVAGGLGFLCDYVVRVTNIGPDPYVGPIIINDKLPAAPVGAVMTFANVPPWLCLAISPTEHQCMFGPTVLLPGESVDLFVTVDLPVAAPVCHLDNLARIVWTLGFGDTNPADDFDLATATIPAAHCPPPEGEKTNLEIEKFALNPVCRDAGAAFECDYLVVARNTGPGVYDGEIKIDETVPAGTTATFWASPKWSFTPAAPYSAKHESVVLDPNQNRSFGVVLRVPKDLAPDLACKALNKVKITEAQGGTDQNTDPTDDEAEATMILPGDVADCPDLGPLSNLKLFKTGPDAPCPVGGGSDWVCEFKIKVQNFGNAYTSNIQFIDALPFGTPAGATISFEAPAGWSCGGPVLFPTLYQCSSDNPDLAHLESVEIVAKVKVPVGPVASCEITNNAQLVKAPGGTLTNSFAGDDMSSASAQLAPVFPLDGSPGICLAGNLKLEKTQPKHQLSFFGECPASGGAWTCPFTLKVTNHGDPYTSEIQIVDGLVGASASTKVSFEPPAEWDCGELHANFYQCRSKNPKLGKGESVPIPGTVKIPLGPVDKCEVTNNAKIVKAPGGTSQNLNGTDDFSSVAMKLKRNVTLPNGQVACSSKRSNLKIEKTPHKIWSPFVCPVSGLMWVCEWKIKVTNLGDTYTSPLEFTDYLWGTAPASASIAVNEPAGWDCQELLPAGSQKCRSENPNLKDGESVEFTAIVRIPVGPVSTCKITNRARITLAHAGTSLNEDWTDDKSSSMVSLAAYLPPEYPNVPAICVSPAIGEPEPPLTTPEGKETNLTITKTAGASQATATGQNTVFTITVTNAGPGVYNGPIEIRDTLFDGVTVEPSNGSWSAPWVCEGQAAVGHPEQGICTHPAVGLDPGESVVLTLEIEAPNSFVAPSGSQVTCGYENKVEILQPAGGSPQNINAGDDVATAEVKFAPFEKHGQTFCEPGLTTPPPPPPACPQGWSRTPVPGKCCPPRSAWDGKRCKQVVTPPQECPTNSVGAYPDCRCKPGFTGTPPNCKRVVEPPKECPKGFRGTPPNCTRIVDPPKECPKGFRGTPPNCTRIVDPPKECPKGFMGTPPNCTRIVEPPKECPKGFRGTPPNCKRIVDPPKECPKGFRGTPPNCKRIVEPPKECPKGFRGTPPNCKRIVDPPKECPKGFRGTPPNCKRIVDPPKECPEGFRGTPPNCKRVVTPPTSAPRASGASRRTAGGGGAPTLDRRVSR